MKKHVLKNVVDSMRPGEDENCYSFMVDYGKRKYAVKIAEALATHFKNSGVECAVRIRESKKTSKLYNLDSKGAKENLKERHAHSEYQILVSDKNRSELCANSDEREGARRASREAKQAIYGILGLQ